MDERVYLVIDLKSFYASVECRERGLDPMTTNLVVADPDRTEKTICLAVSPAMKKLGVPGRCRIFEIPENIKYIIAVPRMQLYIDYSAAIYSIYLKYISKEDIHVYSIDEVFADVTDYLRMYQMTARQLGKRIMDDIYDKTGITASCGIGTNLYLAKVALDITAKHAEDHIGYLDEMTYRKELWDHKPLTDFWRIGKGIAKKLEGSGIFTMGDLAHAREEQIYRMFGIDAELLLDHAWGEESVTMSDIKNYRAKNNSIGSGQVLGCDADCERGRLIVREMADMLSLELVDKGLITDSVTLHIGYNKRMGAKPAHGTINLPVSTNSASMLMEYTGKLYDRIINPFLPVHRLILTFLNVTDECFWQYDLFCDPVQMEKEQKLARVMLDIKEKYGKNAILKGMNLQEGATAKERNTQIGGHRSGKK